MEGRRWGRWRRHTLVREGSRGDWEEGGKGGGVYVKGGVGEGGRGVGEAAVVFELKCCRKHANWVPS